MPMAEEPELAHEGLCGMLGRAMTELCKGRQELAEAVSATLSQEEAQKLQDWMKGAGA